MYKRIKLLLNKPAVIFKLLFIYCIAYALKALPSIEVTEKGRVVIFGDTSNTKRVFVNAIYLLFLILLLISCTVQMFGKFWIIWYNIAMYISYSWDTLYFTDEEESSFIDSIKEIIKAK